MPFFKPKDPTQEELEQYQAIAHGPAQGPGRPNPPAPYAPPPPDPPAPAQEQERPADMTFSVDEANPPDKAPDMSFDLTEADPQAAALRPADMVIPFAEANPDPEAAQRVPALAPIKMTPTAFDPRVAGGAPTPAQKDPWSPAPPAPVHAMQKMAASRSGVPAQAQAPSFSKGQAPQEDDYRPPSPGMGFLRSLGTGAMQIAGGMSARHGHGSPRTLDAVSQVGAREAQNQDQDEQARAVYSTRLQNMKRQGQLDTERQQDRGIAAQDRTRRLAREDKSQALSDEAHDPNSKKNALFRQAIEKTYPEVWAQLTEDQRSSLTIADAQSLQPMTSASDRNKAATTAATLAGQKRQNHLEDSERLIKYKQDLKNIRAGKGGSPGLSGGTIDPETMKALADTYGGEDKIPPLVKRRAQLAAMGKRGAATNAVLGQTADDKARDEAKAAKAALDATKGEMADVKERIAYNTATEPTRKVLSDLDRSVNLLKTMGVDVDNYNGESIPGVGMVKNAAPAWALSHEGKQVRQQILGNVANLVLELSGKAATDAERKTIKEIEGAAPGWGPAELVTGLQRLRQIARDQIERVGFNFPKAKQAYDIEAAKSKTATTPPQDPKVKWD